MSASLWNRTGPGCLRGEDNIGLSVMVSQGVTRNIFIYELLVT